MCSAWCDQEKFKREFVPRESIAHADLSAPHLANQIISLSPLLVGALFDDPRYVNGENEKLNWFRVGRDPTDNDEPRQPTHDNYYFVSLFLSLWFPSLCFKCF